MKKKVTEQQLMEILERADMFNLRGDALEEYLKREQEKIDAGEYEKQGVEK
ncbi:MAG: hypothetical protein HWN79_17670 [Candidatus Lokiarchaeota archaeon]|nr:hypothetical protein [Candidatus Lokiarchaeota archaeon]